MSKSRPSSDSVNQPENTATEQPVSKAYTPKKGHATPSRKQAQQHSGSFESRFSPGATYGETRKARKELKNSMSSEEWKQYKAKEKQERRERSRETQAAMDRGEERYLLPRDKGEERRFIRDFVDSRRYLNNWVMPFAIILLLFLLVGQAYPTFGGIVSMVAMLIMFVFFIEGIWLGKAASQATKNKFPNTTERGFSMGFYAYGRATQPRKWRTPKPRVNIGDKVS